MKTFWAVLFGAISLGVRMEAGEPVGWKLEAPEEGRVYQRDASNRALVVFSGAFPKEAGVRAGDRVEARRSGEKRWVPVVTVAPGETGFRSAVAVAAGYSLYAVRVVRGQESLAVARSGVLVGEVFVVAGQSNSANHGEERLVPQMPGVMTWGVKGWQVARDPQPGASGDGGSFVPALGDALARGLNLPVGFVCVGSGGTSVREWLPAGVSFDAPPTVMARVRRAGSGWESDGALYNQLSARVRALGPNGFRAVLWHQGESDANQSDATRTLPGDLYARFLGRVIAGIRADAGWAVPWMVAQVSYHTPNDRGSEDIRQAQASLWKAGLALQGPDTDALGEPWRDGGGKGVHFNGAGLREHGRLWGERLLPWVRSLPLNDSGRGKAAGFGPVPAWPALKAGRVETFMAGGRPAFVFLPEKRQARQPWVFYAPTLPGHPDEAERWMHEQFLAAGVAVAGVDVGEAYGSPLAHPAQDALYREVRRRYGFAARGVVLGRSRGGLIMSSWAASHPSRVSGVAGIYPVFDVRSYPGLQRAAGAYGLTSEELTARLDGLNPVSRVGSLAKAGVPVLFVHGDSDKVVPIEVNSSAFAAAYGKAGAGGLARVVVLPGRGHDMDAGFFHSEELVRFVIERAGAGR